MRLVSLFIFIIVLLIIILITLAVMLTGGVTDLFGYAAGVQWLSHSPRVTHTQTHRDTLGEPGTV